MSERPDKDQRTEQATPKKRQEAREQGQVPMSQEFIAAVMLCAGFGALLLGGERVLRSVAGLTIESIAALPGTGRDTWQLTDVAALLREPLGSVLGTVVAVFVPVVAIGVLVGYGQIGIQVTPKAVAMDLTKLDPIKGVSRLFSARSAVRTGLAALKIVAIALSMGFVAWSHFDEVVRLGSSELGPMLAGLAKIAVRCTATALVCVLVLSIVDLLFQRFQHERDLRMSKQEIKEEFKSTEGDPRVRARIRSVQREMANQRMMEDVPEASVVVTNPTHFAVALRYDRAPGSDAPAAPVVVAKGVDHLAFRIRDVAKRAGVHVYEDPPLARALYAQVEIGQQIPEEFYAAVAAVLSTVYRLQGETVNA